MKLKTLSIACAAALGLPAFAQSSATVYGTLDGGVLSISSTSGGTGYIPSALNGGHHLLARDGGIGGSFWGIRGTEDIGGGTSVNFVLQGNVNVTNGNTGGPNSAGTTSFFNQFATVGVKGAWGEVKFGRQVSPMYYALAATDPRGARYFGSALTGLVALNSASGAWIGNNSNVAFGTIYNDNAVVWNSPNWGGLTVALEYAFGEATNSSRANSQQAATVIYDANGLKLSALYYNGYGNNLPAVTALYTAALGNAASAATAAAAAGFSPTANTNRLTGVGALYTTGPWTVAGQYYQARNPAHAIVKNGSASLDMWDIGGGYRITPALNFTMGYYAVKDNTNAGNKATQFAAGVEYSFSRRTMVYVQAAAMTNHGVNMNFSPVYATPVAANVNVHALMTGIRHSF